MDEPQDPLAKCPCNHCGTHLEFEHSNAGETIACPRCGLDTTLFIPSSSICIQPPPMPIQKLKPVSRFSLITIGVVGAVILAFLFVGVYIYDHAKALTADAGEASPERPRRYVSLTEEQSREAQAILKRLKITEDEVTGVTWFRAAEEVSGSRIRLYFGGHKKDRPTLRLKVIYSGERWVFVKKLLLKIDDELLEFIPSNTIKRDNTADTVWEIIDGIAKNHEALVNRLLNAKRVIVRFEGDERIDDHHVSSGELKNFRDVWLAYIQSRGLWREP